MGPIVTAGVAAPTHDLIRLREPTAVTADGRALPWVEPALRRTPWVVVRRGRVRAGRIPVGVRGSTRSQRFAAWLSVADVAEERSPEDLWDGVENRPAAGLAYAPGPLRREAVPVLDALARVSLVLRRDCYRWGPGGSVGFELATGAASVTASSDLDIILRLPRRVALDVARALWEALVEAAAPVRIDVLLETPRGAVSLADLATAPRQVLVRTPDGARLAADPWAAGAFAATERVS